MIQFVHSTDNAYFKMKDIVLHVELFLNVLFE
jgi:hypothetical protein